MLRTALGTMRSIVPNEGAKRANTSCMTDRVMYTILGFLLVPYLKIQNSK